MSSKNLKVAVIGLGSIGKIVASNLVKGNREVILASRNIESAKLLAGELGTLATASEIGEAIKKADIIVLAVWFNTIKELLQTYSSEFKDKIIVDPSNPIAPNASGGFDKIIEAEQSAGLINASYLPNGAKLVKALGTLGAASLKATAFQQPERAVLFYASENININEAVEQLIADSGFDALKVGGLDQSIRIEVFGDLHEFGALGKTVNFIEAKEKL